MKICEIKQMPTTLEDTKPSEAYHESLLRSYQTLIKVKELLSLNTPQSVILEIIEEIYGEL